jgi:hypothetical protein
MRSIALLRCYATMVGCQSLTFPDSPSSRVLYCLTLEHGTGRLSRNVGNYNQICATSRNGEDLNRDFTRHNLKLNTRGLTNIVLTYLLSPWCRVLPEQLTGLQLVKKFPAFHGTRTFITALTSVHHMSLSWASPIQSIYPHPTTWRSILILSTHLRLGLPSSLFPSGFPTKTLYSPSPHP